MGPDALPLQFVRIPLDEYMPVLYNDVSSGGSDLDALYDAARSYFDFIVAPVRPTDPPMASPVAPVRPTDPPMASPVAPVRPTDPPMASPVAPVRPTDPQIGRAHV